MHYILTFKKLKTISIIATLCIFALLMSCIYFNVQAGKENRKIENVLAGEQKIIKLSTTLMDLDKAVLEYKMSGNSILEGNIGSNIRTLGEWKKEILAPEYVYLTDYITKARIVALLNEKINYTTEFLSNKKRKTAEVQAETTINTNDINSNVAELLTYNRSVLQSANENKSDIISFLQGITLFALLLVIVFIAITGYYLRNYFQDLKAKERLLHYNASLIRNISDAIITTDKDLRITNWNNFAEELFGFTEAEARGKKLGKLLKIQYNNAAMSEMMDFFVSEKDWRGEALYFHKSGKGIPVDVSSSVIKANGINNGIILVVRDISERNEMHQKLSTLTASLQEKVEAKTKELSMVFERVGDAFIALDNDLNYTYVNEAAAKFENVPVSSLLGKQVLITNPDKLSSQFYQALLKARKTQQKQNVHLHYETDGSWHEAIIYPSKEGLSIYIRNITDSKSYSLQIEQMHQKLRSYIKGTPLAVAELDDQKRIVLWNSKAEELFGWTAQEAIGKRFKELNFSIDLETIDNNNDPFEGHSSKNKIVTTIHTKTGKEILCQWYNTTLKGTDGKVVGSMLFAEDITERATVEEELKQTEAKFRSLVEQSMVGVYIIQEEKLAYVNPMFARIFGYEPQDMMENVPSIEIVHPSDREKVAENVRSRIRGDVNSINYQFKGITKLGESVTVEVFGSFIKFKGAPAIIGSVIDITQRIHFMEQLEKNRKAEKLLTERFLLAAKATNNAMWDWDISNNKLWANQVFCDMLGLETLDNFSTEKFIELVHPDDRKIIINQIKSALKNRVTHEEAEFRLKMADGNYVIIHDKAYFIYDDKNWGVRILGAFEDVTEKRNAERKIKHEKDLSDSIINSLPGIFYVIDETGTLKRWNKNLSEITGFNNRELEKFNIKKLIDVNSLSEITDRAKKVIEGGTEEIETTILGKNGEQYQYQLTATYINYEGEKCMMGVGIDVSERSRIQTQLIKSEEKYRMLIEQASDGIFITNAAGNFSSVNSSMTLLTGYSKAELIKMNVSAVFENPNPEEVLRISDMRLGDSIISERIIKTKSGDVCTVEVSYKLMPDGRFQGIVRDITFRKAAEEALKVSESKYRILFDKNPLPMFILDTNTQKFLDVNTAAREFYGYSKSEFAEKNLFDLMSHENNTVMLKNFGSLIKLIQNGGVYNHYKKDGTEVIIDTIIHDIVYEGQVAKLIVAADETDKIKAQESLKESHESLRQLALHLESVREAERTHMAREIHDELGQQLTGLKMDISWLSRRLQIEDETISHKLKDIIQLIDKTVVTVRRLATELRPSILDDLGLISALEWQSEEFQKRSEIKSFFSTNDPSLVVNSDTATNIFRIFQESLTNVLRHSHATEVTSKLTTKNQALELEIIDNGRGFNISTIESKKTLGLLGMKERVLLMGGSYDIFSKPGQGTVIKVSVPFQTEIVD